MKFPIVINETAVTVLRAQAASPAGQEQLAVLLKQIKATANHTTAEPIWALIKDVVTERMFNEFKSVYGNDNQSARFVAFISTGVDMQLTDATLEELEGLVVSALPDEGAAVSHHGFFAANPDTTGTEPLIGLPAEGP